MKPRSEDKQKTPTARTIRVEGIISEEQRKNNEGTVQLLTSWGEYVTEEAMQEQKDTWEYLKQVLDEDRPSDRKLFP